MSCTFRRSGGPDEERATGDPAEAHKDANINTLASQHVEPLPFHGMTRYPPAGGQRCPDTPEHRRYRRGYNTRYVTQRPFLEAIRAGARR